MSAIINPPGTAGYGRPAARSGPRDSLHESLQATTPPAPEVDAPPRVPLRDGASQVDARSGFNGWWQLVKRAATAWIDDYAPSMGAALSYYTVFSLAPLLLIVISIAGLVFGADAARGEIFGQLRGLMGDDAAKAVEGLLANVSKPTEGIMATVIGVAILLVGATSVFGELQDALDRIWRAPQRAKAGGLWGLLRARLFSFGMILGIVFLLMVSLVTGAVLAALGKWWGGVFGEWEVLAQSVNVLVGFLITTGGFAMIYKIIPRVKVHWQDVWLGAVVTAVLFTVGKILIGLYIGKSGVASGFGAAGSLVIVLVWVYYSAQIFLMGAEFTWVYAGTFGSMRETMSASIAAPGATDSAAVTGEPRGAAQQALRTAIDPLAPVESTAVTDDSVATQTAPDLLNERPSLGEVLTGIAALLAFRYVLPRLMGRRRR